ncbi:MAG TPA: MFS transporter [Thermomicrobiales bacterium]|nr:MFS transporter [Thermomicrobiales bacterium]
MVDSPRSINRILLALCCCTTAGALNFLAMTPFYPEMSSDLGVSVSVVGQIVTFMVLLSAFLGLVLGPVVDRYGFRRPLVLGLCCVAINLIGAGLAPTFPVMLGLSLIGGLGDALVFGIPFAVAGTLFAERERKRAFSWLTGAMSLGAIIGIPLLTVIGSVTSWRLALIVCGAAVTGAAVFTASALPRDRRLVERQWSFRMIREAYEPLLHHSPTIRLLSATAIRSVCWLGFLTYMGAFLHDEQGLSTREIGLVYTVGATGFAIGCSLSGRFIGASKTRVAVGVGCVVTALATVAIVNATSAWLAVAMITILAMASSVVAIGVTFLISTESPAEQGTTMLLNGSVINFGTAAGAALGGGLIALDGYRALGLGLSIFALVGAGLVLWPQRKSLEVLDLPTSSESMLEPPVLPAAEPKTGAPI